MVDRFPTLGDKSGDKRKKKNKIQLLTHLNPADFCGIYHGSQSASQREKENKKKIEKERWPLRKSAEPSNWLRRRLRLRFVGELLFQYLLPFSSIFFLGLFPQKNSSTTNNNNNNHNKYNNNNNNNRSFLNQASMIGKEFDWRRGFGDGLWNIMFKFPMAITFSIFLSMELG